MHEGVLDTRIVLNEPVLTEFKVEVFHLIHREGMVMSSVEVSHLRLLLGNLGRWPGAWIDIGRLQAELRRVHVVLLSSLHRSCGKCTRPPEEDTKHNVSGVVDIEDMLTSHKVLSPEVLPKRSSPVVGNLKGTMKSSAVEGDELIRLDISLQGRNGFPSNP